MRAGISLQLLAKAMDHVLPGSNHFLVLAISWKGPRYSGIQISLWLGSGLQQLDLHAPVLRVASGGLIGRCWGLCSENSRSNNARDRNTPGLLQVVDHGFSAVAAQLLVVSVVAGHIGKTFHLDNVGGERRGAACKMH